MSENAKFRKLYVGNLDPSVSEELLLALFGQLGTVRGCKIIHEPGSDPYAFIEFVDHQAAAAALLAMNKRLCLGKEMKVNWATNCGYPGKIESTRVNTGHYHIFVGDLAPEIEMQQLRDAFAPFGEISDVKIMRFPDTHKPKGYGFVSFINRSDAENAIASMNGQWLGTRKIRTNWATRKVQPGQDNSKFKEPSRRLEYDDVWSWTSDTNTSVYCGGILDSSSSTEAAEELLRSIFGQYGQIVEIRVFKEKGFGFIKFSNKESACAAICGVHGMEVYNSTAKCGWGRDDGPTHPAGLNSITAAALFNAAAASLSPELNAAVRQQPGPPTYPRDDEFLGPPDGLPFKPNPMPFSNNIGEVPHERDPQWCNWWSDMSQCWSAGMQPQHNPQMGAKPSNMIAGSMPMSGWTDNPWQHQAPRNLFPPMMPVRQNFVPQAPIGNRLDHAFVNQMSLNQQPIAAPDELRLTNPGLLNWNEPNRGGQLN